LVNIFSKTGLKNRIKEQRALIETQREQIKDLQEEIEALEETNILNANLVVKYENALKRISLTTMSMGYTSTTDLANDLKRSAREALKE
jgi:uncharacterized protein YigA (DUF484 family)